MLGRYRTKAKVGAIDIGSNAVRALVLEFNSKNVKEVYSKRIPFRLRELHSDLEISNSKKGEFVGCMSLFNSELESLNVKILRACATSALRESKNKDELIEEVQQNLGIQIECISGEEEVSLVYSAIKFFHSFCSDCVLVDLGGGSLEIAVFKKYKLHHFISLGLGTLKVMEHAEDPHFVSRSIQGYFKKEKSFHKDILKTLNKGCPLFFSGGNARAVLRLIGSSSEETDPFAEIEKRKIEKLLKALEELSPEDRMCKFKISKNRADVIYPAVLVFSELLNLFESEVAQVPDLGLKHGIAISNLF